MTDYHIHTLWSDGRADAGDYISAAVRIGLNEMGFSEHLNLFRDEREWCMDPHMVNDYISQIRDLSLKEKRIAVRTGLEVDYFPGGENSILEFTQPLDLDYLIGSVHYLGDTTVDSGPEFFAGKDVDKIYRDYFELLYEAVESGLFDIIGHLDLVRTYNFKPSFNPEYLYRELAAKMSLHDVAFEFNTNGRNRHLADFYPDTRFLHLFSEKNVPVCVNSDAHFPSRVGQFFGDAYSILKDAGYREMCSFRKRERYMIPADFSDLRQNG